MSARQHKIILEEVLKNTLALSLIGSPKLKAYIMARIVEDAKKIYKKRRTFKWTPKK